MRQTKATNTEIESPDQQGKLRATAVFRKMYDEEPHWAASAPGRVNLIGDHTDYNDGFVLPMALDRQTTIVAGPSGDQKVTLHSLTVGETVSFSLGVKVTSGEPAWSNYVRGVIAGFQDLNLPPAGFNAVVDSSVPLGGGLSSSAALEVATATLLEAMTGQKLDPEKKALLCQKAEHDYAGVRCGIMDQFISVMGRKDHLLLLDCRTRATKLVTMNDPSVAVLIVNTNVRHKLTDGEYGKCRAQCEAAASVLKVPALRDATLKMLQAAKKQMEPLTFRRARHVITENARTKEAAKNFSAGDWRKVGRLMYASHASLKNDYGVSCPELDAVVEIAQAIGVTGGVMGCRMTGSGLGGCAVALVKTAKVAAIAQRMTKDYLQRTNIIPTWFVTRAVAGASIVEC
ncbi:MAG: galactokinase [Verrucomicrobiota bacterium]|jgi:galactokinase